MTTPVYIEALRRPNLATVIAESDDLLDYEWANILNNIGDWQITLHSTDPAVAELRKWDLVNFFLYDLKTWTGIITRKRLVLIAPEGEAKLVTELSGPGLLAARRDAAIYQPRGAGSQPYHDDRILNALSVNLNEADWPDPNVLALHGDGSILEAAAVEGWLDPDSAMVWGTSGSVDWAPPEVGWGRDTFTVPAGIKQVVIQTSGRNEIDLCMVDDVPIDALKCVWPNKGEAIIDVTQGEHLIGGRVVGYPTGFPDDTPTTYTVVAEDTLQSISQAFYGDPRWANVIFNANQALIEASATAASSWDPNRPMDYLEVGDTYDIPSLDESSGRSPKWFEFTVWEWREDGTVGDFIARSANGGPLDPQTSYHNTIFRSGDSPPPGMGPAYGSRLLLGEAHLRGRLLDMLLMFTDTEDFYGEPWPYDAETVSKIGYSLLAWDLDLAQTYVDVWMLPADPDNAAGKLGLAYAIRGTRGASTVPGVELTMDTNLTELEYIDDGDMATILLARWALGFHERKNLAGIATYGGFERFVSLGALNSIPEVNRTCDEMLADYAHPRVSVVVGYIPADLTEMPYHAFDVGDSITIPGPDGDPILARVVGIIVGVDAREGHVTVRLALGDVILDAEAEFMQTARKMLAA